MLGAALNDKSGSTPGRDAIVCSIDSIFWLIALVTAFSVAMSDVCWRSISWILCGRVRSSESMRALAALRPSDPSASRFEMVTSALDMEFSSS